MNRRFAPTTLPVFGLPVFGLPLAAIALIGATALKQPATKRTSARAAAPIPSPPIPSPPPLGDTVRVALVTELGAIEIELDHKHAPVTVENFVRYVDLKRFDGISFYRSMRLSWGQQPNGLIQAGLQGNPIKVLKPIAHEPTSQTGISHKAGTISMARYAPGTATADFSILLSDLPALDADPKSPDAEAQAGYAAFGQVVTGMDVVRKIWDAPLSPTRGEGPLKGQMLEPPVKVLSVRRVVVMTPPAPQPVSSPRP